MRDTPLILPYATSDLLSVRPALTYALLPRLGSRRCLCTRRSRRLKRWERRRDPPRPKRSAGSTTALQEHLFGALEAVEMTQAEHPMEMPFGIHDAGRDVIAAAEI